MKTGVFPLETPRLRLEAYAPDDFARAHAVFGEPGTLPEAFTLERTRAWVDGAQRAYLETGTGNAAIVLRATGETIGDAGIRRVVQDGDGAFDLSVTVRAGHRRSGYASEIARALLTAAFGTLRMPEVRAIAPVDDALQRRFLERSGLRLVRAFVAADGRETALYAAHAPVDRVLPLVKMCGMTSPYDAELAVAAGAHAVGMIFAPSERRVTLETAREIVRALPPFTLRVAVFVDAGGDEVRRVCETLGALPQFSGGETPAYCERYGGERAIRVVRVARDATAGDLARAATSSANVVPFFETLVAGAAGGTGRSFDWSLAAAVSKERRIGISGGLTPENVAECVRIVRPYAVDVRSGVETGGRKNFERMQAFVAAALGTRAPAVASA